MTTQPSSPGPLSDELRQLLRLIEDVPEREPEPQREATIIPARTLERHRVRDDATRRPTTFERPAQPAAPVAVPPAAPPRSGLTTRALSMAVVGVAGAVTVTGWFILGQRTNATSALAGNERSTSEPAMAQLAPPLRSATAPAKHTPNVAPAVQTPTVAPAPAAKPNLPNLNVQPITTTPNERVRFVVRVEPMSSADNAFIRIQGLPKGTTLSRGRFVQPDSWIVPAGDAAALELTLGDVAVGRFEIAADLQADNGRSLARAKSQLVVDARPTNRAAAVANVRPGLSRESGPSSSGMFSLGEATDQVQDKFLAQGLRLLLAGSVNSARLMLQRAADAGDANAALILGDTYDEVRLSQLGAQGVLPDRDKANFWYGRADELGSPEAKDRLSEVNSR
jgi:hypothetical protein